MDISKIIYVAAVIEDGEALRKLIPEGLTKVHCHHVTLRYGNIDKLPNIIGTPVTFVCEYLSRNHKAAAVFGVLTDPIVTEYSDNGRLHITLATSTDTKPVYSSKLPYEGCCEFIHPIRVPCIVGAFVEFSDNHTGWVFHV